MTVRKWSVRKKDGIWEAFAPDGSWQYAGSWRQVYDFAHRVAPGWEREQVRKLVADVFAKGVPARGWLW